MCPLAMVRVCTRLSVGLELKGHSPSVFTEHWISLVQFHPSPYFLPSCFSLLQLINPPPPLSHLPSLLLSTNWYQYASLICHQKFFFPSPCSGLDWFSLSQSQQGTDSPQIRPTTLTWKATASEQEQRLVCAVHRTCMCKYVCAHLCVSACFCLSGLVSEEVGSVCLTCRHLLDCTTSSSSLA